MAAALEPQRNERKIGSPRRTIWRQATPEETVRQEHLRMFVNESGFKLDQIAEALEVMGAGSANARADVAIWRSARETVDQIDAGIVVGCASDNVSINSEDDW
jgi:type I restriction enzyme M protein